MKAIMKNTVVTFFLVFLITALALPASATRKERVNGVVEYVDSEKISVAGKSYRMSKQFRVVVVTREDIHRYERSGKISDIRIGDKVTAVVQFDEIVDIYLERY